MSSPNAPTMPYEFKDFLFNGRMRPHKIYPGGLSAICTDEEVQVAEYVQHLEAENKRLAGEVAAAAATLEAAVVAEHSAAREPAPGTAE